MIPARPGKYEGESPAALWLDMLVMMSAQDDLVTLDESSDGAALFRGPITPTELHDAISETTAEGRTIHYAGLASEYGWTLEEITEARSDLESMAGAILDWTDNGFVSVTTYATPSALQRAWSVWEAEYQPADDDRDDDPAGYERVWQMEPPAEEDAD